MQSAILLAFFALVTLPIVSSTLCRIIPSDAAWPSQRVWDAFNASVDGRLIHNAPVAMPCHASTFDAGQCDLVQTNWHDSSFHEQSSSSIMSAVFANRSCDPFNGPDSRCIQGTYVEYTVNASTQAHVVATVRFAAEHNIRFVVRNSAHDYMGKSTGHGALAVWMHHLTSTTWTENYIAPDYRGPAVTAQAGVSVLQMYEEASARGYAIIGGACPTVGYAGGFIQGGGHGPLSSLYGLAADDVLEYEVITTAGIIVTATRLQNADLFWALSGGGPGTFAILWSVTVKVHPDMPVTGASVIFTAGPTVTLDTFWAGVDAYRSIVPNITNSGGYALAIYEQGIFELQPLLLPYIDVQGTNMLLEPFLDALTSHGIPYNLTVTPFPGFLQAYQAMFDPTDFEIANSQLGGRLLPMSSWESAVELKTLNNVIRNIIDNGGGAFDIAVRRGKLGTIHPNNAVFPPWNDAITTLSVFIPWIDNGTLAEAHQQQLKITNEFMTSLKAITPTTGAYMNEADAFDPDWKETFYGVNYPLLLIIKDKWDPAEMLFGTTAVGGDRWEQQPDGRLCRVFV